MTSVTTINDYDYDYDDKCYTTLSSSSSSSSTANTNTTNTTNTAITIMMASPTNTTTTTSPTYTMVTKKSNHRSSVLHFRCIFALILFLIASVNIFVSTSTTSTTSTASTSNIASSSSSSSIIRTSTITSSNHKSMQATKNKITPRPTIITTTTTSTAKNEKSDESKKSKDTDAYNDNSNKRLLLPVYYVTKNDCHIKNLNTNSRFSKTKTSNSNSNSHTNSNNIISEYGRALGHIRAIHRAYYDSDNDGSNNSDNDVILIREQSGLLLVSSSVSATTGATTENGNEDLDEQEQAADADKLVIKEFLQNNENEGITAGGGGGGGGGGLNLSWKKYVNSAPLDWKILTINLPESTTVSVSSANNNTSSISSDKDEQQRRLLLAKIRSSKFYQNGDLWMSWSPLLYLDGLQSYLIRRKTMKRILENTEYEHEYDYNLESTKILFHENNLESNTNTNQKQKQKQNLKNKKQQQPVVVPITPPSSEELLFYNSVGSSGSAIYTSTVVSSSSTVAATLEATSTITTDASTAAAASSYLPSILVLTTLRINNLESLYREYNWIYVDTNELCQTLNKRHGGIPNWRIRIYIDTTNNNSNPHEFVEKVKQKFSTIKLHGISNIDTNIYIEYVISPESYNKFVWIEANINYMKDYDKIIIKDSDQRIAGMSIKTYLKKSQYSLISSPVREIKKMSFTKFRGKDLGLMRNFQSKSWMMNTNTMTQKNNHNNNTQQDSDSEARNNLFYNLHSLEVPLLEQYFVVMDGNFASWYFNITLTNNPSFLNQYTDWGIDAMWCSAARSYMKDTTIDIANTNANANANANSKLSSCLLIMITSVHEDSKTIGSNADWYQDYMMDGRKALIMHQQNIPQAKIWHSEKIYEIMSSKSLVQSHCNFNSHNMQEEEDHIIDCVNESSYTY
ncbi:hypothetical protein FRACYDRAFT_233729 [Fragilariopsis cylindrus CCMP1102]|uniref:Uncharacterized protein n=1 Tax=Fragilariopsis cylindrus CCMP1102 TaxID=635003 RepID=A0A1E7FZI7_9STRA|nr:hypothetical protein FRACYDRAFT_233729 [Fragilariopsis cylindrus CCMP1102]|eukprot:OEU23555.1 hypothetical protein FRACYDRAFT_233729 [Fragilariopsis cylindrus CCMP1102]